MHASTPFHPPFPEDDDDLHSDPLAYPGADQDTDTIGSKANFGTTSPPGTAGNPGGAATIHCPRCHSPRTSTRNIGRKVGGTIGTAAGAASGISRVLAGAEIGATLGIWAGPAGPLIGGVAGAVLSGLFGGAAGCALGATLGEVIDHTILDNHRCHSCSHHFSVPPVDR